MTLNYLGVTVEHVTVASESYILTEPVGPFGSGQTVTVVARYGEWHLYDVKLQAAAHADDRFVELTAEELDRIAEPVPS